ncbi:MAG: isocitrate/isopropylmalate family dehydrogenase [Pseudomonadota bacterium]
MLEFRNSHEQPVLTTWANEGPVDIVVQQANAKTPVVFLEGDGIGPEISNAARQVIDAAFPHIEWIEHLAGDVALQSGISSGVSDEALDAIARTGTVFKGPLTTILGSGRKNPNTTIRKLFELYANVRPVMTLPGVRTAYANQDVDMILVRDNIEDYHAGMEHMQTPDVIQSLNLTSRSGSERINRFSFELARAYGRDRVTCATNAGGMKLAEGLFRRMFEEVAADYPEIMANHLGLEACVQTVVTKPAHLDVVVTSNMSGDIPGDLAAGMAGGLSLVPSANIGTHAAVFEPAHGTVADLAGQNFANPTAMLLSGVMMLRHIGAFKAASQIEHALYVTLEEGRYVTPDLALTYPGVTTETFVKAVIDNLGETSALVVERELGMIVLPTVTAWDTSGITRSFDGLDVFIEWDGSVDMLASKLNLVAAGEPFVLENLSNRGTSLYPSVRENAEPVNHWCCRFKYTGRKKKTGLQRDICALLEAVSKIGNWMHIERLQSFNGNPAYSPGPVN